MKKIILSIFILMTANSYADFDSSQILLRDLSVSGGMAPPTSLLNTISELEKSYSLATTDEQRQLLSIEIQIQQGLVNFYNSTNRLKVVISDEIIPTDVTKNYQLLFQDGSCSLAVIGRAPLTANYEFPTTLPANAFIDESRTLDFAGWGSLSSEESTYLRFTASNSDNTLNAEYALMCVQSSDLTEDSTLEDVENAFGNLINFFEQD